MAARIALLLAELSQQPCHLVWLVAVGKAVRTASLGALFVIIAGRLQIGS